MKKKHSKSSVAVRLVKRAAGNGFVGVRRKRVAWTTIWVMDAPLIALAKSHVRSAAMYMQAHVSAPIVLQENPVRMDSTSQNPVKKERTAVEERQHALLAHQATNVMGVPTSYRAEKAHSAVEKRKHALLANQATNALGVPTR